MLLERRVVRDVCVLFVRVHHEPIGAVCTKSSYGWELPVERRGMNGEAVSGGLYIMC